MKLLLISFGVVCLHLAVLVWVQVNQHGDHAMDISPIPVQTRQILESAAAPQPLAQPDRSHPETARKHPVPQVTAKEVTPAISPSPITASKANVPMTAALPTDADSPTRPEKSGLAATPATDPAGPGKAAAPASVQLPSTNAEYLNNPAPAYPALSLRLNEKGKVVVRVLIGKNGTALEGAIIQSSGYERLDQSALRAVLNWRYVPGKVDGQPKDMWFDVPINFKPPG